MEGRRRRSNVGECRALSRRGSSGLDTLLLLWFPSYSVMHCRAAADRIQTPLFRSLMDESFIVRPPNGELRKNRLRSPHAKSGWRARRASRTICRCCDSCLEVKTRAAQGGFSRWRAPSPACDNSLPVDQLYYLLPAGCSGHAGRRAKTQVVRRGDWGRVDGRVVPDLNGLASRLGGRVRTAVVRPPSESRVFLHENKRHVLKTWTQIPLQFWRQFTSVAWLSENEKENLSESRPML
jgi:hypothetical protein